MQLTTSTHSLSVITPSYNHARYIRQTIESVFSQDMPNMEHIVVDGGSQDGTIEILREYEARHPGRFRWVSEPDRGQSHAFNKGLAMARGTIIGWQNSDDYYLPRAFRGPVKYLQSHPEVSVVYSDCVRLDESGKPLSFCPPKSFAFDLARQIRENYIPNQSAFVRREALVACGGLNEGMHFAMDYDLWMRLGIAHTIEYLPGVRGVWRILPGAKTHSQAGFGGECEAVVALENLLQQPDLVTELRPIVRQRIVRCISAALVTAIVLGRDTEAAQLFNKLVKYDPILTEGHLLASLLFEKLRKSRENDWPSSVPKAAASFLTKNGYGDSQATRQIISLVHLVNSLNARRAGRIARSLSELIRACSQDVWWIRSRGGVQILAEMGLGQVPMGRLKRSRESRLARQVDERFRLRAV